MLNLGIRKPLQPRASNPFEARDVPPHMNMQVAGQKEVREYQPVAGTSRQASGPSNNNQSHRAQENHSKGNTSAERQSPVRRNNQ